MLEKASLQLVVKGKIVQAQTTPRAPGKPENWCG